MKLSDRLEMIASFVTPKSRIADVGTDHGYIPIVLVRRGIALNAVAMDVREGPLGRAREHIRQYGLERQIETRLSDGVQGLKPGEADTIIIAGMGGGLLVHILKEGRKLWEDTAHWILSPHSELWKVRHFLIEQGFALQREAMVKDGGKYYTVMDVMRGEMAELKPWEYCYGPCLIRDASPVLREFLEEEKGLLESIKEKLAKQEGETAWKRREELEIQLTWIREVWHEWERMDRTAGEAGANIAGM